MKVEVPYKSLKHTLQALKVQVQDSMPYIGDYVPKDIKNPEDLFYFLKSLTKYKKDPHNIELLQTVQTLMSRGGRGDCDCFTILALAACEYLGFEPQQVVLVGKSSRQPSHIYSMVWDEDKNKMCSMDLTNPYYDTQRPYPYKQTLNFMMTLRLEDDGGLSKKFSLKKLVKKSPLVKAVQPSSAGKARRKEKKRIRQERKTAKKVGRQQRKLRRVEERDKRKNRRMDARAAKHEAKAVRKEMKAKRKVQRATSRTERAAQRQAVRAQRTENRMIRATGRGEIIARRQQGRLDKVDSKFSKYNQEPEENEIEQQQEASHESEFVDPSMDVMPDVPGGDYSSPDFDQETEDADYEVMPEEETDTDVDYSQYEMDPQMEDGLSFAPIIAGLIKGGKKLIQNVANTQAGQAVQKGASIYNEIKALKDENSYLKSELSSEKNKKYYFGGGGFVAGYLANEAIRKFKNR